MSQKSTYTSSVYLLTALSNMHVGSGDTNYGVVDKQVQRDPITEFPVIHSSGLKGAFREFFHNIDIPDIDPRIEYIFGTPKEKSDKQNKDGKDPTFKAGNYRFYNGFLLSLPVRSNTTPFFRATCPAILQELIDLIEMLKPKGSEVIVKALEGLSKMQPNATQPIIFGNYTGTVLLEDYEAKVNNDTTLMHAKNATSILGDRIALFSDDDFKDLCKDLPVIARNNLENGVSTNLWYEEVVPRESRFYAFIAHPDKPDNCFENTLGLNTKANCFVQIGGNASIGYGHTKFERMDKINQNLK